MSQPWESWAASAPTSLVLVAINISRVRPICVKYFTIKQEIFYAISKVIVTMRATVASAWSTGEKDIQYPNERRLEASNRRQNITRRIRSQVLRLSGRPTVVAKVAQVCWAVNLSIMTSNISSVCPSFPNILTINCPLHGGTTVELPCKHNLPLQYFETMDQTLVQLSVDCYISEQKAQTFR